MYLTFGSTLVDLHACINFSSYFDYFNILSGWKINFQLKYYNFFFFIYLRGKALAWQSSILGIFTHGFEKSHFEFPLTREVVGLYLYMFLYLCIIVIVFLKDKS